MEQKYQGGRPLAAILCTYFVASHRPQYGDFLKPDKDSAKGVCVFYYCCSPPVKALSKADLQLWA